MPEASPVRYVVEFEFPDADTAQEAHGVLRELIAEAAEIAGAAVARNEFIVDESSVDDPDGELLAKFEAHVNPELDLFDPGLQERLDAPLSTVLLRDDLGGKTLTHRRRMLHLLKGVSLETVRDVFVRGKFAMGVRGVSVQSEEMVASELGSRIPELPLLNGVSPIIAARFCSTLDQITVPEHVRLSVADVLSSDPQELAIRLGTGIEKVAYLKDTYRQYAAEFNRAKVAQQLRS